MGGFGGGTLWGGPGDSGATGTALRPLLYMALRLAGVVKNASRIPGAPQLSDALQHANFLMSRWNVGSGMIFTTGIAPYDLTSGKKTYTIGSGGEINATRPIKITGANLLFPDSPVTRRQIRCTEDESEWKEITLQDLADGIPRILYNDRNAPLSTLYLFPQPGAGYQLEIYSRQSLQTFASLDDVLLMPEGYDDAITLNTAVRLAMTPWPGQIPMDPEVRRQAMLSRAAIEQRNARSPRMNTDPFSGGKRRTSINWLERES